MGCLTLLSLPFTYIIGLFGPRDTLHRECSRPRSALKPLVSFDLPLDRRALRAYSLIERHMAGDVVGKGAFGEVRKAKWLDETKMVAIKAAAFEDMDGRTLVRKEVEAMIALNPTGLAPRILACTSTSNFIYYAQELVEGTTADKAKDELRQLPPGKFLSLFMDVFRTVEAMSKLGLLHNDIKPQNIMVTSSLDRMYLIDYGFADALGLEPDVLKGTRYYLSTSRLNFERYRTQDDLYALALSMAIVRTSELTVFRNLEEPVNGQTYKLLPDTCFKTSYRPGKCERNIVENIKEIFEKAGYGAYQDSATADNVNLTTLLAQMIRWKPFPYTIEQLMAALARILKAFSEAEALPSAAGGNQQVSATNANPNKDLFEEQGPAGGEQPLKATEDALAGDSAENFSKEIFIRIRRPNARGGSLTKSQILSRGPDIEPGADGQEDQRLRFKPYENFNSFHAGFRASSEQAII